MHLDGTRCAACVAELGLAGCNELLDGLVWSSGGSSGVDGCRVVVRPMLCTGALWIVVLLCGSVWLI